MSFMEIWKDMIGFEGLYQISSAGRVRRLVGVGCRKVRYLKSGTNDCGYLFFCLSKNGKSFAKRLNRLVAIHFIPNPNDLPEVNHKKGDKLDNRHFRLEWSTVSYNRKHAWDTGLNRGRYKISEDQVRDICNSVGKARDVSIKLNVPIGCVYRARIKHGVKKTAT